MDVIRGRILAALTTYSREYVLDPLIMSLLTAVELTSN